MKNILAHLTKRTAVTMIVLATLGTTVATSAFGAVKVAQNFNVKPSDVPEIRNISESQSELQKETKSTSQTTNQTNSSKTSTQNSNSTKNETKPTTTSSTIPNTPTVSTTSNQNTTGGCIITLFGKQYDVQSLRSSHSGGDVFACGTDMTAVYQKQHGTNVSRMQPYLVTGTAATGSTVSSAPNGTPHPDDDTEENEIENEHELETNNKSQENQKD